MYFPKGLSELRSLIFIILISIINIVSANELVEYDWLTMGEKTGSQTVKYKGNSLIIDFEFFELVAAGKPSTMFPPGKLVKLPVNRGRRSKINPRPVSGKKAQHFFIIFDWENDE